MLGGTGHQIQKMKTKIKRTTFVCIVSLVAGCTGSTHYPVVTVDAEHHIVVGSGKDTPPYEIAPAAGIQLDIGHFQFTRGGVTVTPDTVQVGSHSQRYRLAQPIASSALVLDASTLTNASGAKAFPGFN